MASIDTFKRQLSEYLSRQTNPCDNLVKFEVSTEADFSFLASLKIWRNYIDIKNADQLGDDILMYAAQASNCDEAIVRLKEISSHFFVHKIDKIQLNQARYLVKLDRNAAFTAALKSIMSSDYGRQTKVEETVAITISELEDSSITNFRLQTLALVLKNLLSYSKYIPATSNSTANHKLLLTTRSNSKKNDCLEPNIVILCSVVRDNNESSKKISHMPVDEYFKKRMDDMQLMALHKYGLRIKDDEKFLQLREQLGEAACKLDMIEVKHTNALTIMNDPKQAFILYNSARIETLFKTFNEKVLSGYYPELPKLEDIDINLLTNDEEWRLLKQLMLFPETVQSSLGDFKTGKINTHLLYKYLQTIATEFSNYYSKKRILTENRPQLIPVIHAKIHLLKAVQRVFKLALKNVDIQPVSFM